jgi:hypothetical protein
VYLREKIYWVMTSVLIMAKDKNNKSEFVHIIIIYINTESYKKHRDPIID